MNSDEMKIKLLFYWRFQRGFKYAATEADCCDVLVSNEKEIIDCEVKISFSDFKQDFKKRKHEIYLKIKPKRYHDLPNRFYFAVPPTLTEKCLGFLKENYPAYGLIEVGDGPLNNDIYRRYVKIKKRSRKLNDSLDENFLARLVARMSSELSTLRYKIFESKNKI